MSASELPQAEVRHQQSAHEEEGFNWESGIPYGLKLPVADVISSHKKEIVWKKLK